MPSILDNRWLRRLRNDRQKFHLASCPKIGVHFIKWEEPSIAITTARIMVRSTQGRKNGYGSIHVVDLSYSWKWC
ncbi:MAG: hypothetical protein KC643_31095, partial [Nitrospira sp.]|nr:hypothetical protein [Nitrospira sp.]